MTGLRLQVDFQVDIVAAIDRIADIDDGTIRAVEDAADFGDRGVDRDA